MTGQIVGAGVASLSAAAEVQAGILASLRNEALCANVTETAPWVEITVEGE
jgi:hypothetical protein